MDNNFKNENDIYEYVTAGKAIFTVTSKATNKSFTYKAKNNGSVIFVSVLTGPNNGRDYEFIGTLFENGSKFVHGRKSRLNSEAESVRAFSWFWSHVIQRKLPKICEVRHEGSCGKCGRRLTVGASIDQGFGPECLKKIAA